MSNPIKNKAQAFTLGYFVGAIVFFISLKYTGAL